MNSLPCPSDLAIMNDLVFVELSRGCYGHCGYCQENAKMRFKRADRIAEEIESWVRQGYERFYIGNANSMANGKLLREVLKEIESRQLDIHIALVGRPNDVIRNQLVLEQYFQSNHVHFIFIEMGVEANSQHLLDLLGRSTTPEINQEAMQILLSLKQKYTSPVTIHANMILFSHYDMLLDELIDNIKFIGQFQASRETMSPCLYGVAGTTLWKEMIARGFVPQEEFAQQITEYPFSDCAVQKLYTKLFQEPMNRAKKEGNFTSWTMNQIIKKSYQKMLSFYESRNIRQSIFDYLANE
jgi:hypothetical protein